MSFNVKKKVMLAILAGGMLCANGAFADVGKVWYAKTGGNAWTATDSGNFGGLAPVSYPCVGNGTAVTDFCSTGANLTLNGGGSANGVSFNDASVYIAGYGYNPSAGSTVSGNTLTITGGNFTAKYIIAGMAEGQNAEDKVTGNTLEIKDGVYKKGYVIGGFCLGGVASNSVSGNTVKISGGTFGGEGHLTIAGGFSKGVATISNNTVEITGGTFATGGTIEIVGGMRILDGGSNFGHILNLKTKMSGKVALVAQFQTINFTLPSNITNGDVMLKAGDLHVDNNGGIATINVNAANGVKLNKDDIITLVDVSEHILENYVAGDILGGAAVLCVERDATEDKNGDGDQKDLVITLKEDFEQLEPEPDPEPEPEAMGDKEKSPVEGIAATVAMINQSADLVSDEGLNNLVLNTADGTFDTFGAINANRSKYKTGSHVDMDGWGFLVGAGNTRNWKNGEKTTYGLFFEYGKGEFDTYNNDIHGEGDSNNKGVGIIARHTLNNNTYFDGAIRYGKQETEWNETEIGSYDTDSKYFGTSLGIGHIYPIGKNELDIYGRYTYGHTGSCDAKVGENEYKFDSVKSSRLRVGTKLNIIVKGKKVKPYVGVAWEREMKGESKATITGMGEAPAPSLKGNTGIMQAGCSWEAGKWTLGAEANAYIGKRKGWGGMFNAFYNF